MDYPGELQQRPVKVFVANAITLPLTPNGLPLPLWHFSI